MSRVNSRSVRSIPSNTASKGTEEESELQRKRAQTSQRAFISGQESYVRGSVSSIKVSDNISENRLVNKNIAGRKDTATSIDNDDGVIIRTPFQSVTDNETYTMGNNGKQQERIIVPNLVSAVGKANESFQIPSLQNDVLRARLYMFPTPTVPPELKQFEQQGIDVQNPFKLALHNLSSSANPPLPRQIESSVVALINSALDKGMSPEYILYIGSKTNNYTMDASHPDMQATAVARHCATLLLAALQKRGIDAKLLPSSEVSAARKPVAILTELLSLPNINSKSVCVVSDLDTLQSLSNRLQALDSDAISAAAVNHYESNLSRFSSDSKKDRLSLSYGDDDKLHTHQTRGDGGLSARGDLEEVEFRMKKLERKRRQRRRRERTKLKQSQGESQKGSGGGASNYYVAGSDKASNNSSLRLDNDNSETDDEVDVDGRTSRISSKSADRRLTTNHLPSTDVTGKKDVRRSSDNVNKEETSGTEDEASSLDDDDVDLDSTDEEDSIFGDNDSDLVETIGNEKVKVMVMPCLIPRDAITEVAIIESIATQRSAQLLSRGYTAFTQASSGRTTPFRSGSTSPFRSGASTPFRSRSATPDSSLSSPSSRSETPNREAQLAPGSAPPNPVLAAMTAPTTRVCAVFPTRSCRASGHVAHHIQCIIIPGQLSQTTIDMSPHMRSGRLSPEVLRSVSPDHRISPNSQMRTVWSKESRRKLEWLLSLMSSFHAFDVPYARRFVFFSTTPEGATTARYLLTMPRRAWKIKPTFIPLATPLRVAGALAALPPGSQAVIVADYDDALALTKALCFPAGSEREGVQAGQLLDLYGYLELRCSILRSSSHVSAVALPSTDAFITVDAFRLRRPVLYPSIGARISALKLANFSNAVGGALSRFGIRREEEVNTADILLQRYSKESDRVPKLHHYSEFLEEVNMNREEDRRSSVGSSLGEDG